MLEQTKQKMAQLKLSGMLLALEEQLSQPALQLEFEDRLALLIDREFHYRENTRLSNRLKNAKLKKSCSVEQIDFQQARGLNKSRILALASESWIKQHRTVVITGPAGTGKTFLASALAHKACLLGYTARYCRLIHLVHDCVIATREGKLLRYLASMNKFDVLIIDDFGMTALSEEEKKSLLEIIEARYEKCVTIITSQLPLDHWYDYIDSPLLADAFLDRIVHQAEKIVLTGESMRKLNANAKPAAASAVPAVELPEVK